MATTVASLRAVIDLVDNVTPGLRSAAQGVNNLTTRMRSAGTTIRNLGLGLTAAFLPLGAALGTALNAAVTYDEALTNIQSLTHQTNAEIRSLGDELLEIGRNSRYGPQAAAEAMYDIASGVADASTHMAILNAAIATAEAGNVALGSTTSALVSIMNSYGFAADEAAYASDVLTRTVGVGVGTMDEFASALPMVTGLANSLGISFGDVGAMMAYLTTQGNTASQAATQLNAMMTAMLRPNERMGDALAELGFASGEAAIQQLGLMGAYQAIAGTEKARQDGMAALVGSTEALRGVTALMGEGASAAMTAFNDGLDGATEAARAFQNESPAAEMDRLRSNVEATKIQIGEALIPALNELLPVLAPIVEQIGNWAAENPEIALGIGLITAAALVLGPVLALLGTGIALLFGPVGAIALGVIAGVAFFQHFGDDVRRIVSGLMDSLERDFNRIRDFAGSVLETIGRVITLGGLLGQTGTGGAAQTIQGGTTVAQQLAGGAAGVIAGNTVLQDLQARHQAQQGGATQPGSFSVLREFQQRITGRAGGGWMGAGEYVVGERGPERLRLGESAYMVPNHDLGGGNITLNLNVTEGNARSAGMNFADGFMERVRRNG